VIWKNTTQVGCGCAVSQSGAFFFVCNYDPPGNYIGQKPY
jgi:pathogenesis-related protein 1